MKYTAKITIRMVTFVGLVPWLAGCDITSSGQSLAAKPEMLEKPDYALAADRYLAGTAQPRPNCMATELR